MAKESLGSIITIGAVGFGAYWLYKTFLTAPAAPVVSAPPAGSTSPAAPAAAGTPTAPTTPAWMASLSALANQLSTMGAASSLNIDQWSYYYNQLRSQRGMPALTPDQASAIFAAEKIDPNNPALRATNISSVQFVNDVSGTGAGLQGLRRGLAAARRFNPVMPLRFRSGYIVGRRA